MLRQRIASKVVISVERAEEHLDAPYYTKEVTVILVASFKCPIGR